MAGSKGGRPSLCVLAPLALGHRSGTGRYQGALVEALLERVPLHVLLHPRLSGSAQAGGELPAGLRGALLHRSGEPRATAARAGELFARFVSRGDLVDLHPRTWGSLFTTRLLDGLAVDTLGFDLLHGTQNYLPDTRGPARRVVTVLDTIPLDLPDQVSRTTRLTFLRPGELHEEDLALFISKRAEAAFLRHFSQGADRRRVIYLGVDHATFRPEGPAASGGGGPPYVLSVGMFEARKNLLRALHAFEKVSRDRPGVRWKVAGTPGFGHSPFLEALARSPARGRIDLLDIGGDAELAALYRGAAALLFPSTAEGFGLPVLEALACGTPVAASGIPDLEEAGGGATVPFDPLDEDSVAEAVLKAAFDEEGRGARRARGLAHAATFTWARTAEGHLAAYAAALECEVGDLLK